MRVGTIVRVELAGRRVRGWVVEMPDGPAAGVDPASLKPLAKVSSAGPPTSVVALARWAAWRWAGRWVHLLRTASPAANVPPSPRSGGSSGRQPPTAAPSSVEIRRLPPASDRLPLVRDAVAAGPAIVVVPEVEVATRLAARLRREGHRIALLAGEQRAGEWATAASGSASVVGTRIAVWAPVPESALQSIVVLDEHDEALQSEQAPTWHARDVAVERAARAGVPCTLVSPVPTLHALATGRLSVVDPAVERAGWPVVEVADRRDEDPVRAGAFSPTLVRALRGEGRVVCVLNRLGRARLLACVACGATASCSTCGAAVGLPASGDVLRCGACGTERPVVCLSCGGSRFKHLRLGVRRVQEELAALIGEPVAEVTAEDGSEVDEARVVVGTSAVLHRLRAGSVSVVAFLDLDQELLAPRYRAGEEALALLARGARAVGGRGTGGRLLLQTRLPEHPVVRAAVLGDPGRFVSAESPRRAALGYPPSGALAVVSGAAAEEWASVAVVRGVPEGVELLGPAEGRWLIRAPSWPELADWLSTVERPSGRLRVEVDPPRA